MVDSLVDSAKVDPVYSVDEVGPIPFLKLEARVENPPAPAAKLAGEAKVARKAPTRAAAVSSNEAANEALDAAVDSVD